MKNAGNLALVILGMAVCALSQTEGKFSNSGAKALFYDQTSSTTVQGAEQHSVSKRPPVSGQRLNTGLKYWVELVQPDSPQILRVNATRSFHSGERIRLHFESNVDGKIVLLQVNPNGTSQMLFPDQRINNGDNHIKAGSDMTVPAGNAWFTLDNNPGTERVMVFLNEETDRGSPSPGGPTVRAGTSEPAGMPEKLLASSAGGKLDAATTANLQAKVEKQTGGKSLVLEVDDKSPDPANYAVKPVSQHSGSHSGKEALAIEIQLKHQ